MEPLSIILLGVFPESEIQIKILILQVIGTPESQIEVKPHIQLGVLSNIHIKVKPHTLLMIGTPREPDTRETTYSGAGTLAEPDTGKTLHPAGGRYS